MTQHLLLNKNFTITLIPMKRSYFKNMFLSQLKSKRAVEVLQESLYKIEDIDLLNKIISCIKSEELDEFLQILKNSTYNLTQSSLYSILLRLPLSNSSYQLLNDLNFKETQWLKPLYKFNKAFLLNYCYLREQLKDYNNFELFKDAEILYSINLNNPEFYTDLSMVKYHKILSYMLYNLKNGMISQFNIDSFKNILGEKDLKNFSNSEFQGDIDSISQMLISTLNSIIKDPFLKAILDINGRVNAKIYSQSELILISHKQIYNLDINESMLIYLCQNNSVNGICKCCNRLAASLQPTSSLQADYRDDFNIQKNLESKVYLDSKFSSYDSQNSFFKSYNCIEDVHNTTIKLIENLLLQPDVDFDQVHRFILHCPWLRTSKYFKLCLKQYILFTKKPHKEQYNYNPNSILPEDTSVKGLKVFDLFEMDQENESIAISFLKTSSSYYSKAIVLIPYFMKTTKLYFSCFIVLLEASEKNSYFTIVAKNLIYRYNLKFISIINLILEYTIKVFPIEDNTPTDLKDKEFLCAKLSKLSNLFSESPESFVNQNIHSIFNAYYPSANFTKDFIDNNAKYVIIQKIIDRSFNGTVQDVDVLVGLMFQDHFNDLNSFFKPDINFFIRKNLSHILFKIKNAYSLKLYNRKTCVYKIMKFVLSKVNIPLYFSYLWPYIEFFLNREYCICAEHVLDWLRDIYNSKLMAPYLMTPFEKIEDFPLLPNIETKIYPMLARFFSKYKISFEFSSCPFQENIKSTAVLNSSKDKQSDFKKSPIFKSFDSSNIHRLYLSLKENLVSYTSTPLIADESFIENFLINFKKNKLFRNKICKLQTSIIPIQTRALFGNIKYDVNVDAFPKAPENIPKSILENFLLKINYERQDLFAFTIQEFLKSIKEPFEPEIENFVQQFRHTKFDYKMVLKEVKSLDFTSYRNFLESLFYILYFKIKKLSFLKYLVLFDDTTVEYSCLCLIKIVSDNSLEECISVFKGLQTSNIEILKFVLKINTFVGKDVIGKKDLIKYSLVTHDFYSLIYNLEVTETDNDILQLSYFMIGDYVRVRGFNTISAMKNYSTLNLFFDFIIDKNYKAGVACLNDIYNNTKDLEKMLVVEKCNSHCGSDECILSIDSNQKKTFITSMLKNIVDRNADYEVESLISGKYTSHPGVTHHILKDLELLTKSSNLDKTIELINERRSIADDSYLILKIHKYFEHEINIESFTKSVDQELINYYIQKKDYQRAEEEIAKFLLKKDFTVLFNLAQIKIATKCFDEAKELLKRIQTHCDSNSKEYFKATVKLAEICPTKATFESGISSLETALYEVIGEPREENCDFNVQKSTMNSPENKIALLKLENICKKLENQKNSEFINGFSDNYNKKHSISHAIELFNNLQRMYFLTAKYFEKHNQIISIKYYFKSLISNHEAIPRFFHLLASTNRTQFKIINKMIETIVKEYLKNLIPFYKQISTKIALDTDASKFFKLIISEMMEAFPYQTHWNSLFLYNSKKAEVVKIMSDIVDGLSIEKRSLFSNIRSCSEKLTGIAKSPAKMLSMENFPDVRNLFPAQINVPGEMTEINNIKNEILIFRSLQMPKKITFVGEDGKEYPMIVKFKDDLRKDSRFMDVNDLLNKLFDEGYYIRKYNVIPFTHESGIIEFIPNLVNLKEIVTSVHKNTMETIQRFIKTKMIGANNMITLEKTFNPVFRKYLKDSYKDPYQFYKNRENYIKTYAIMNIVGWYMGLGDRHAENIHFDKLNGDTVHVDLNCIFEKGKSLEIPEKVPFRLTQNIIDGFGVLQLEGTYRHTMKYTLELLKENRDVIQANLLSFVFDPLLEWSKKKTEPSKIIEGMDLKLDFEDYDHKIQELINEATDYNNLGSMYIGWMAFI